jgi:hypothetical protein
MPPNLPSTLSLLALLLSQPTNAAPTPAPQTSPKSCNPTPCATVLSQSGWEPYCHQGALYCTIGPGMLTIPMGRCEEWCQPEAPKPTCPPAAPPQRAENCKAEPCVSRPGWEPYCYQGALYCTSSGMLTVPMGKCEEWCPPAPKKPAGCP